VAENVPRRSEQSLQRAREAVESLAWEDALEAFAASDEDALGAEDLESWATASYLLGRADDAVEALSRAYRIHIRHGDTANAARIGFWIVFMLAEQGDVARSGGWMSRLRQLMDQLPSEGPAHGYMLALTAYQQVAVEGEYEEGRATAERVVDIGRSSGDHDLEALALNLKGRALIRAGEVGDGLVILDEAMVAVTSGLPSPVVVGTVYCSLIEACEEVVELRRARLWTDALTSWCERQSGELPFTAQCRVHRSLILQRSGSLKEAEEEARLGYETYTLTPYRIATGRALYQLAEVQRARGEFDLAESTYRQASDWGIDPQPGLALLHVARGETGVATASLHRLLAETEDPLERLKLLPALVDVMLAAGDLAAARHATAELVELASTYDTDAVSARAAYAEGAVSLAADEARDALVSLRSAVEGWRALEVPYEIARTRLLIGEACRRLGDDETASLESKAARRQLDDLGIIGVALPTSDVAEEILSARERDVLRLLSTGMTNREIADELYLSVKTVDRHVGNILTKLGVATRTGAVSYAYENRLL